MNFKIIIPSRYASVRLAAKPLVDLGGKPMVVRVADLAKQTLAQEVWVATDHEKIRAVVEQAGHAVVMTKADHATGTDRLAEAAKLLGLDDNVIVVNLQGDEPLLTPDLINAVAQALEEDPDAAIATASHTLTSAADFFNPNVVKVVTDAVGDALYFTRAPIPWARDAFAANRESLPPAFPGQRHIGVYAYRVAFLRRYSTLSPSPMEQWESLEQLRALWHGYRIRVVPWQSAPESGIDTPEDLERVRARFE